MAAGLSFNMGDMFGLHFRDEADQRFLYCLWSEASVFEPALTQNAALELTSCWKVQGLAAPVLLGTERESV